MSTRINLIADGKTLEGLAYFANLDGLPYSLDDTAWENAGYWELRGSDDTPEREKLVFSVRVELLEFHDDTPERQRLFLRAAGYDWITRAM